MRPKSYRARRTERTSISNFREDLIGLLSQHASNGLIKSANAQAGMPVRVLLEHSTVSHRNQVHADLSRLKADYEAKIGKSGGLVDLQKEEQGPYLWLTLAPLETTTHGRITPDLLADLIETNVNARRRKKPEAEKNG